MIKTEVHVAPQDGRWRLDVDGVSLGAWTHCQALKLALRTARAVSAASGRAAKVVIHERDGAVRSVLSFGEGLPLRLSRRRGRHAAGEARLPVVLAARYARDLDRLPA